MPTNTELPSKPAFGLLAKTFCGKRLPLQILQSQGGFYIGTADGDGPVSRESGEYYVTHDAAQRALALGAWTQRPFP